MPSRCQRAIALALLTLTLPLATDAQALEKKESACPSLQDIDSFHISYLSQLGSDARRAQALTPSRARCAQDAVRNSKGAESELNRRGIAITNVVSITVAGSGHAVIAVR
ncbi:MAG: hypothetical protein KL863_05225 [Rhizobium sp.]|nr:hypothetical protein [Rhizobium sp.]